MKATHFALLCLLAILVHPDCYARDSGAEQDAVSLKLVADLFPDATRTLPVESPIPHLIVFDGKHILGYSFFTDLITPIPAYSGYPIRTLVSIKPDGTIIEVRIISHQEPILVIGVNDEILTNFTSQYEGMSVVNGIRLAGKNRPNSVDGISGATITAMVLNGSAVKAARLVLEAHSDSLDTSLTDVDPLWLTAWQGEKIEIVLLITGLTILVLMLLFQDWVVVNPRFFNYLRIAFLVYTVFFIGFYCLAQLSIINAFTFISMLTKEFSWDIFLLDPVVFILWSFVALSILLWGRGIFCGWLCPFGAIQELMNKIAHKLNIRQYEFPLMVHERLLALKYVILMALVGLALNSIPTVATFSEIEPFKTAISLRFQREWYFSAYAIGLILISTFNTKFYCRYICPLGALLSFSSLFKIFSWLRRRPECGTSCHTCGNNCSVGAINNKGEIDESECHYCLECQTSYWDEHHCPVMVSKRERRERRDKRKVLIPTAESDD